VESIILVVLPWTLDESKSQSIKTIKIINNMVRYWYTSVYSAIYEIIIAFLRKASHYGTANPEENVEGFFQKLETLSKDMPV
jgi:hypothetical protein